MIHFAARARNACLVQKILLTMKLTTFLLLFAVIQTMGFESFSQGTKLSLNFKSTSLKEVLSSIEDKTEYYFLYSSKVIDVDRKIDVDVNGKSISEALDQILKDTDIEYLFKDRQILLSSKNNQDKMFDITQQQNSISGKVSDTSGGSLPGVSVVVKRTTTGTITDADGKYSLNNIPPNVTLQFSFVGMKTQEITVTNQSIINVVLADETIGIEEVVAIGYGTVRKSDLTGSVASIKGDDIRAEGNSNVQMALQGKTSGVSIQSASGSPGSGVRILIRGTGSLNNNDPLYIVDGVQVNDINNILPSDIGSMEVLKDASAAAIYGSRASNGVVLITTKSGEKGETKIDVNFNYGVQKLANKLDVLNARQWAQVENDAAIASRTTIYPIFKDPSQYGNGTDWQNEIYRVAPTQSIDASASGGTETMNFSISGGYLDQDGIILNTYYKRLNLRVKTEFKKGRFTFGESAIISKEDWHNSGSLGGRGGGPAGSALKFVPVFGVYDAHAIGGYSGHTSELIDIGNPVAMTQLFDPKIQNLKMLINLFSQVKITEGLNYKYNVGYTNLNGYNYYYVYPYSIGAHFVNLDADLSETRSQSSLLLQEHTLNFSKDFNKHHIQAFVGYTFQTNDYRNLIGGKSGMPNGIFVLDAGSSQITSGGTAYKSTLESYLGRIIYSYDDKYLVTATFRRDGSSRFSKNNRYGNFPSIALGWNLSNETFFAPFVKTISQLKIRGSYGVLGNQEIGNYLYSSAIQQSSYATASGLWVGGTATRFSSPNIKWEKSKTFDVGIDWGFFSNKLTVSTDYFIKRNSDILLAVPLPLSAGSAINPIVNAGDISNKGFEGMFTYRNKVGALGYEIIGTFTSVKNKVENLGSGSQQIFGGQPAYSAASSTLTQKGGSVGAFYLIKTDGIFNSQEDVLAHSKDGVLIQPNAKSGDIRFVDYDKNGVINESDRQLCGSPTPKFEYGFGTKLNYKGFDMYMFFQGTYGNKIFNGLKLDMENIVLYQNHSTALLDAWTENNHSNIPRLAKTDVNENNRVSDRYLESGSYLRLKTLQLGYTIPKIVFNKIGITNLRVFVSGENILTFTKYSGYNPDLGRAGSILDRGVDLGSVAYPLSKTITFGLQLSF